MGNNLRYAEIVLCMSIIKNVSNTIIIPEISCLTFLLKTELLKEKARFHYFSGRGVEDKFKTGFDNET